MPTLKQQEAYRLVHIVGITQEEAADMLGITQAAVSLRLRQLKRLRPDLFDLPVVRISKGNTVSFDEHRDCAFSRRF
jgi:predicted DNA-binding protein (UPF0251 family)